MLGQKLTKYTHLFSQFQLFLDETTSGRNSKDWVRGGGKASKEPVEQPLGLQRGPVIWEGAFSASFFSLFFFLSFFPSTFHTFLALETPKLITLLLIWGRGGAWIRELVE